MKEIRLKRSHDCWLASEYVDGKPSIELIKYFGTHHVPTAFTENADAEDVLECIQKLNPTATVIFE